jgi:hypothetical protein
VTEAAQDTTDLIGYVDLQSFTVAPNNLIYNDAAGSVTIGQLVYNSSYSPTNDEYVVMKTGPGGYIARYDFSGDVAAKTQVASIPNTRSGRIIASTRPNPADDTLTQYKYE